jgi:hypothetical protein
LGTREKMAVTFNGYGLFLFWLHLGCSWLRSLAIWAGFSGIAGLLRHSSNSGATILIETLALFC